MGLEKEENKMEFDIAFKVKVKNGLLQEFIDKKGWSQSEFARRVKSHPTVVGDWFNLRSYPRTEELMKRVCKLVGKSAGELFPNQILKMIETEQREFTVHKKIDVDLLSFQDVKALPAPTEFLDNIDREELGVEVEKLLLGLKERERVILKMRFGLGGKAYTCREIGEILHISRDRVRQIEADVLTHCRHPRLSKRLKDFVKSS